jgi:hypothetical protein
MNQHDEDDESICRKCGADDADNGEGFDGMCGSCADKAELMRQAKAWIAGNISDEELRESTGCTLTDEELEEHIFIGGDPELAENHAAILVDAIIAAWQN